jgi:hypothetical protein
MDWATRRATHLEPFKMASIYLVPVLIAGGVMGMHRMRLLAAIVLIIGTVETLRMYQLGWEGRLRTMLGFSAHFLAYMPYVNVDRTRRLKDVLFTAIIGMCILGVYFATNTWPYPSNPLEASAIGIATLLVAA